MPALADLEKDKFNALGEVKVAGDFAVAGQTDYSATDITALGASTSLVDWVSAYHDSQLTYKYVEDWEGTQEKIVYLTHPSLGDGYKCLRLFYIYTTQNNTSVVESVNASVVDWTYDDEVQGTISLTLGTVTSPAANATAGTDVCTVTITNTGSGSNTLSLSGTNASLYQLNNTTQAQTGSTLTNVLTTDTVVVETASDFTNVTYSHSLTVTLTENNFNQTASQNISTSGTEVATFANEFQIIGQSLATSSIVTDFQVAGTSNLNLIPSQGYNSGTTTYDSTYLPKLDGAWSISFWLKTDNTGSMDVLHMYRSNGVGFAVTSASGVVSLCYSSDLGVRLFMTIASPVDGQGNALTVTGEWIHVAIAKPTGVPSSSNLTKIWLNGVAQTVSATGASGTLLVSGFGSSAIANTRIFANQFSSSSGSAVSRPAHIFEMDELAGWNKELTQSDVDIIYGNGEAVDLANTSIASDLDSHFRMGDYANDDVPNNRAYDVEDSSKYIEKVGTGNHSITQLTMNDSIYYSASGNHKYIEDANRSISSGTARGNYNKDTSSDGKGWFPDLESSHAFRSSPNVSWSFWIKCVQNPGVYSNFFYEYYDTNEYLQFGMASSSRLSIYSRDGGSSSDRNYKLYSIASSVFDDNWHHLCITTNSDDVATGATLYLDGVAQSPSSTTTAYSVVRDKHTQSIALMGSNFLGAGGTINVAIDEFSTWKKQLSASEVLSLYNSGSPTDLTQHSASADLQRWFRMGDTTGDGVNIKDSQETSYELASFDSQDNTVNH